MDASTLKNELTTYVGLMDSNALYTIADDLNIKEEWRTRSALIGEIVRIMVSRNVIIQTMNKLIAMSPRTVVPPALRDYYTQRTFFKKAHSD